MGEYKENYVESLRQELVDAVQKDLSPIALAYHYSDVPLEINIKWRPIVMLIGNYSSGKSTLINELLGGEVQDVGQAPTDDSFTVLTCPDDGVEEGKPIGQTEERDGKVLLYDDRYPFKRMRRYGERFAAHFRLKKINSPFLQNLALIDTPGMLDSTAERDRGYNYQEVIGDLAHIADLILVLFDPHKAGTVLEVHKSLRETLPGKTFEDRVVFVLNRIDECSSLNDLLRVYGTLCWNLSQITGRKDIPMILLTYAKGANTKAPGADAFLTLLENQRERLKHRILQAPRYRLDHLASYIETHGERLEHFLEALISFGKKRFWYSFKFMLTTFLLAICAGTLTWLFSINSIVFKDAGETAAMIAGAGVGVIFLMTGFFLLKGAGLSLNMRHQLAHIDELTKNPTQARQDTWEAVKNYVHNYIKLNKGKIKTSRVKTDLARVAHAVKRSSKDARSALAELDTLKTPNSQRIGPDKEDESSAGASMH